MTAQNSYYVGNQQQLQLPKNATIFIIINYEKVIVMLPCKALQEQFT